MAIKSKSIRSIALLLSLITMTACGSEPNDVVIIDTPTIPSEPDTPQYDIDKDLFGYLTEFRSDALQHGITLPDVNLRTLKYVPYGYADENIDMEGIAGVCIKWTRPQYREILIAENNYPACAMKALMYHELAHCYLDAEHTEGQTKTIMNDTMWIDEDYCNENWTDLTDELFSIK